VIDSVPQPAAGEALLSAACREAILAERARYPHPRSALLPALKLAQAEVGYLPPAVVAAVAELVGVSGAQAQELTTFYSMLHRAPTGKKLVQVCTQVPCGYMGGDRLLARLEKALGIKAGETTADGAVTLERTVECMGACHRAPMCRVGDGFVENLRTEADVAGLATTLRAGSVPATPGTRNHDCHPDAAPPSKLPFAYERVLLPHQGRRTRVSLAEYRAEGGYQGLDRALKQLTPAQVIDEVKQSNLRGRGGAAFSTGMKWGFVPKTPGPKYLVVNADESEPGTFKDRELMEVEAHLLLEGIAIASYAIGSSEAFVYIRGEYVEAGERLRDAIAEAKAAGVLGRGVLGSSFDLEVHVFLGAGAYICGEETALLESLEGRRPMPRSRPPFPAVAGLYGKPTVVNNVETIANVPHIIKRGAAWFRALGPNEKSAGPKIYCLSGAVNRPRQLRAAARQHDLPRADRALRRRRVRRPRHQGCAAGGHLGADRAREQARREARLRGCAGSRLDARLGVVDRRAKRRRHGARRDAHARVLPPRVVRQVHAVPRRHRVAARDPEAHRVWQRQHGRPRPLALSQQGHHGQGAVRARRLRDEPRHRSAAALPRRVRRRVLGSRRGRQLEPAAVSAPVVVKIDGRELSGTDRHAARRSREAGGHRDPGVLPPREAEAGRRVPHVRRRGRTRAAAADRVHDARREGHGRAHGHEGRARGARGPCSRCCS
jgi:NADH:ubiquinone oxidoreductase subunit E